jgi:hypothetical protein
VKDRFDKTNLIGGPTKVLGCFYDWLRFNKIGKSSGPVRAVVRKFILSNFPVDNGADVLGETVGRQQVHSVHSLAKLTGEHPKTINRAMTLSGLLEGDPDKPSANAVFDANAGEALMRRISNSISTTQLPRCLNCNRVQAQQFVRTGLIPQLNANNPKAAGVLTKVALADVHDFLSRFMAVAEEKLVKSEGVMDVISASEVARWPVLDIVNGVLAGQFKTVEIVDRSLKFKGVLVDPFEVRESLSRMMAEGWIGIDECARIIGMPTSSVSVLAKLRQPDGAAYIADQWMGNSKGTETRLFSQVDVERFCATHISLKEISEDANCTPKVMKMRLDAKGLAPFASKGELGRVWYRRCDL